MIGARAALAEARTLAEVARHDPSDGNRQAVRLAIGAVARLDWRFDARGYNPYRDKGGRFAPGVHKQNPKSEAVTKAAAHVEHTAGKRAAAETALSGARKAKAAAVTEARSRLAEAKTAAALARKEPSAINVKAAKQATARATAASALARQHTATVKEHAAAHAAAKAAHIEAKKQHAAAKAQKQPAEAAAPTETRTHPEKSKAAPTLAHEKTQGDPREFVTTTKLHTPPIANFDPGLPKSQQATKGADAIPAPGSHGHPDGNPRHSDLSKMFADRSAIAKAVVYNNDGTASFTPEGQRAMRAHLTGVAAAYGMRQRDLPENHVIYVVSSKEMGGSAAQFHDESGHIRLQSHTAQMLTRHADYTQDELKKGRPYDSDEIQAYHYSTHESLHGHGPTIPYEGHGILADEMATEVSARRITADIHNLESTDIGLAGRGGGNNKHGAYNKHIYSVADAIGRASGRGSSDGYKSLEHAGLAMKRLDPRHEFKTGDDAMHHLVELAANHAGIKDPTRRAELHEDVRYISNDLLAGRAARGQGT